MVCGRRLSPVAAYLDELDISKFDPKAPPPKTPAFWDIVDANRAPEEGELADVLDGLGKPDGHGNIIRPEAVTLAMLIKQAGDDLADWLRDRRNRRAVPHRLEKCGYVSVRNEDA